MIQSRIVALAMSTTTTLPLSQEDATLFAKDAVFLAPHKFAGGPGTPKNRVKSGLGGGGDQWFKVRCSPRLGSGLRLQSGLLALVLSHGMWHVNV